MCEDEKIKRSRLWEAIKSILEKVGKVPLCNERADRAPHIFGKCFILCWRCTSLIGSMMLSAGVCWLYTGNMYLIFHMWEIVCSVVLMLPTFVDGIAQYVFEFESTNRRRFVLGCVSGVGLWLLASWLDGVWRFIMQMERA